MNRRWLAILAALVVGLVHAPAIGDAQETAGRDVLWRIDCVDCPKVYFELGDRSLALNAQGHARVVYAADQLLYAWYDGVTWQQEVVDDAPGIDDLYQSSASLALDGAGTPHLSYLSATSTTLKHAIRTLQGWQVDTVDTLPSGQVFNYDTALAVDRAGNPHIAYPKNGRLYYAVWSGSRWHIQLVDPTQKAEFHVSLALDGVDHPHISYTPWNPTHGASLTYAHWTGSTWIVETVDDGTWVGYYNSIAVDHQGMPHISFLDYTTRQIKYAHHTGGGWHIEAVDTAVWPTGTTSLTLDGSDRANIAYISQTRGLCYARWTGIAWEIRSIDGNFWYSSLALDSDGHPHISYTSATNDLLKYAVWAEGEWSFVDVRSGWQVAADTALVLDEQGHPRISFYDPDWRYLRLAWGEQFGAYMPLVLRNHFNPRIRSIRSKEIR